MLSKASGQWLGLFWSDVLTAQCGKSWVSMPCWQNWLVPYLYYTAYVFPVLPVLSLISLSLALVPHVGCLPASKHAISSLQQQDDSLEKVIKDTESLFKSREKEYQETIDQIEVGGGSGDGMAQKGVEWSGSPGRETPCWNWWLVTGGSSFGSGHDPCRAPHRALGLSLHHFPCAAGAGHSQE